MSLFEVIEPGSPKIPLLLSIPHAGTLFPEDIRKKMKPEKVNFPDDTDWFVDKLYGFASDLGITIIVANYNRWVVDLNRNPHNTPLYSDGRVITEVISLTDFNGDTLYEGNYIPDSAEKENRLQKYFYPYHQKIEELLTQMKKEFGKALLFDAHSIRKNVPGIQKEDFPELILGDNDGASAHPDLINTAVSILKESKYSFSHNFPFKGGYITRSFGKPQENIHALQLEMAKSNYMDDSETRYSSEKAEEIRKVLIETLMNLNKNLLKLKF